MARGSPTFRRLPEACGRASSSLSRNSNKVVDHRLAPGGGRLAELIGALIAPVTLLSLDHEFLHVAKVGTGLADEIARAKFELLKIVAAETRLALGGLAPLARDQRHADGAHHAVVRRHGDLLAQQAGEGGGDGVVVSRAALEVNHVADLAPAHHAVEVIEGDGIRQAGHQVGHGFALVHPAGDVALHEHGAALAQARGAVEASARLANSPLMLMPSFSACSSRNEPVPAAQASFMAKSTTTWFSMEMNLESCPPISKMVSTGSPPRVLLMWMAPVL